MKTTRAQIAEMKLKNFISIMSMSELLDLWEYTARTNKSEALILRAITMEEIEKREPKAFDEWLESDNTDDYELRKYMRGI